MRLLALDFLQEEMIVARDIYLSDGTVLLTKGTALKKSYIEKLKKYNVFNIYIEDELSQDIIIDDVIRTGTRNSAIQSISKVMKKIKLTEGINAKEIEKIVSDIINQLLSKQDIILGLSEIRSIDDYTFGHSVNVSILSIIIGMGLGYNEKELFNLGLGAMLHDIGKALVDEKILNKPDRLTDQEFEHIKTHTTIGYEILKSKMDIEDQVAIISLYHHERCDGKGYPHGLKKDEIPINARIVSIADVFDALTSDRVYKHSISNFNAIEYLISMSKHQFDEDLVNIFIQSIPLYPPGTMIKLNSGETAIVLKINKVMPTKPIVRILRDGFGVKYSQVKEVDLSLSPYLYIVDIVENK